jgi:hypothetical protein
MPAIRCLMSEFPGSIRVETWNVFKVDSVNLFLMPYRPNNHLGRNSGPKCQQNRACLHVWKGPRGLTRVVAMVIVVFDCVRVPKSDQSNTSSTFYIQVPV